MLLMIKKSLKVHLIWTADPGSPSGAHIRVHMQHTRGLAHTLPGSYVMSDCAMPQPSQPSVTPAPWNPCPYMIPSPLCDLDPVAHFLETDSSRSNKKSDL